VKGLSPQQAPDNQPQRIELPKRTRVQSTLLIWTGFAVVTLLVLFALRSFLNNPDLEPEIRHDGRTRAIQLDVLNGTGEPKLAQRATDFLRARGFDVVEIGNVKDAGVEATLVIDRVGNIEAANLVAAALGVSEANVTQRIDKNLFLDVSVILGSDYKQLKAFQ
jgi:hypothetical protein